MSSDAREDGPPGHAGDEAEEPLFSNDESEDFDESEEEKEDIGITADGELVLLRAEAAADDEGLVSVDIGPEHEQSLETASSEPQEPAVPSSQSLLRSIARRVSIRRSDAPTPKLEPADEDPEDVPPPLPPLPPEQKSAMKKKKKKKKTTQGRRPYRRSARAAPDADSGDSDADADDTPSSAHVSPFFSREHVRAMEQGRLLFDPRLVDRLTQIGKRLGNVDTYASATTGEIAGKDASMLLGDLQDFLAVMTQFEQRTLYLADHHASSSLEAANGARSYLDYAREVWRLVSRCRSGNKSSAAIRYEDDRMEKKKRPLPGPGEPDPALGLPPTVKLPFGMEQARQQRARGALLDAILQVANEVTDIYFVAVELFAREDQRYLAYISVAAIAASQVARLGLGLSYWRRVDWASPSRRRRYLSGLLTLVVEPALGMRTIQASLADEGLLLEAKRDSGALAVQSTRFAATDPIADQAAKDFDKARTTIFMSLILLLEDLPQMAVQAVFVATALDTDADAKVIVALVMTTTVVHILRQLWDGTSLLLQVPALNNLKHARSLVLDAEDEVEVDADADDQNQNQNQGQGDGQGQGQRQRRGGGQGFSRSPGSGLGSVGSVGSEVVVDMGAASAKLALENLLRPDNEALQRRCFGAPDLWRLVAIGSGPGSGPGSGSGSGSGGLCFSRSLARMAPSGLFTSMRNVQLSNSASVDGHVLAALAERCPSLQRLELSHCERVDDAALAELKRAGCRALEAIHLDACRGVSDAGVKSVAEACDRSLLAISLRRLPLVTSKALKHLAKRCSNLREVVLDAAEQPRSVEDDGVHALAIGCPNLRSLKMPFASRVSERGMRNVVFAVNPRLRSLDVTGNDRVTDRVLRHLGDRCRHLRDVRLAETGVTDRGVRALSRRCRHLEVVALERTTAGPESVSALRRRAAATVVVSVDNAAPDAVPLLADQISRFRSALEAELAADADVVALPELKRFLESGMMESMEEDAASLLRAAPGLPERELACLVSHLTLIVDYLRRLLLRNSLLPAPAFEREDDLSQSTTAGSTGGRPAAQSAQLRSASASASSFSTLERREWWSQHHSSDFALIERVLESFRRALRNPELERGFAASPFAPTIRDFDPADRRAEPFPPPALRPFAVMPVDDIDLKVRHGRRTYEFVVSSLHDATLVSHRSRTDRPLVGSLSALLPISAMQLPPAERARRLSVPAAAAFFCYAYPINGAQSMAEFPFHLHRTPASAAKRLLTFGGFLLFDGNANFVMALAKDVGSAYAFDGPFPLPPKTARAMHNDNRWVPAGSATTDQAFMAAYELPKRHRRGAAGAFALRRVAAEDDDGKAFYFVLNAGPPLLSASIA